MLKIATFAACLLAMGCGSSEQSSARGSSAAALKASGQPKFKFRTENTPLAAASGCYKPANETLCKMELKIGELTNRIRKEHGLAPLIFHAGWSFAAKVWSQEQAKVSKISHTGFPDQRIASYETEFGNDGEPQLAGENVGEIKYPDKSPEEIAQMLVQGWFDSPGHRRNMLGDDFVYIGVGLSKNASNAYFATQLFAWEPEPH